FLALEAGGWLGGRPLVVPGIAQMSEIGARGLDRRAPDHAILAARVRGGDAARPGEDRSWPIDAGMAEPRLRRGDRALRQLRGAAPRERPDDVAPLAPGKTEGLGRELTCARKIEERRQQRARLDRAGRRQLRNGEDLDARPRAGSDLFLRVDEGERRVRRSEVDTDDVPRGVLTVAAGLAHPISTSAGMRMLGSLPSVGIGRCAAAAFQPPWRSTPRYGGGPAGLPVTRTRAGSKPAGTSTASPSSPGRIGWISTRESIALRSAEWIPRAALPICSSLYSAMSSRTK